MRVDMDLDQETSFLPVMEKGFVADVTPADTHLGDIAIKLLIKDPASQNMLYLICFEDPNTRNPYPDLFVNPGSCFDDQE
jgi:hypothetical protein